MGYFMYYSAFILWFDHFLDSGAKICQIFRWFFENLKKSKRHSEINWPLSVGKFGQFWTPTRLKNADVLNGWSLIGYRVSSFGRIIWILLIINLWHRNHQKFEIYEIFFSTKFLLWFFLMILRTHFEASSRFTNN